MVCPKSWQVLGWTWTSGYLKASAHRLSALSKCDAPGTVKGLRSYIRAYRFLSRVIRKYASLLGPLETMISRKPAPNSKLEWSDSHLKSFKDAPSALHDTETIVLPRSDDTLHIITDAALLPSAVGAVMYNGQGR